MARVAIYDSGVGGLSILSEVRGLLPEHDYVFISDNQAYPYGTKPEPELLNRVAYVSDKICERYSPDLLVLACNTASTVCLPKLRATLKYPVVGVVPAIKPAAELTQSNTIGLLATPATIHRLYTDQLINDFAKHCTVIKVGSSELVDMAEQKLSQHQVDLNRLSEILAPFSSDVNCDVLVLACTHFPLLKDEIQKALADAGRTDIHLVDSGAAIAKQVSRLLTFESLPAQTNQTGEMRAAFTDLRSAEPLYTSLTSLGFAAFEPL